VSKPFTAIGLMSGTSLDGIDVAMIETDGDVLVRPLGSETFPYSEQQAAVLKAALADAATLASRSDRPGSLAQAERLLTDWHAAAVTRFLAARGLPYKAVDVIGLHGQTVLHRPERRLTVQLGDGAALASSVGIPVVYDLRAADVAAGGQGAPLVPVYHRALAQRFAERPIAFVNIGGVANITWIGRDDELIAFDTGPGNALLNDWAMRHLGERQDTDGKLALSGLVDEGFIDKALAAEYFNVPPPKSLDRNSFAQLSLQHLSPPDGAATLVEFTKAAILLANDWLPEPAKLNIVCGGGSHNPAIMGSLRASGQQFLTAEEVGLNGDSMEAEAWAYLAVRSKLGLPISFPKTTGVKVAMRGGVLALP
jgi:anhydro-N-acetylmuramic acid kinase